MSVFDNAVIRKQPHRRSTFCGIQETTIISALKARSSESPNRLSDDLALPSLLNHRLIQRNHQRHGDDARQRRDTVNRAGFTGVLTINHRHLGNGGRGGADGGEEADKDDGIAVSAQAGIYA